VILLAADVAAQTDLRDLHLDVVPRSPAEAARVRAAAAPTKDFTQAESFEVNQAGVAAIRPRDTSSAFSQPSGNISFERELDFKLGDGSLVVKQSQ